MKIEILEVFVVHADAITTHTVATPTGIDAIELRPITAAPNRKRQFKAISTFFSLFQSFLTKMKRCYDLHRHSPARQGSSSFVKVRKGKKGFFLCVCKQLPDKRLSGISLSTPLNKLHSPQPALRKKASDREPRF